jgi:lipopolysaccharide export system permease protein
MLRSFTGPFFATFFISMFVLLMQMLWRYIDDLVGKGLDFSIILELLFYFSLTLIPMALPLAVLLSSIMTFGNLGENYELIALKSAGISLYRIMLPLIIVVVALAIGTFLFSNNVLPVANMKSVNLLYDIKKHKPEVSFKEGVFTNDLEGYSIKVDRINKETGMMYNMLIYNHKEVSGNYEVTKADSGMMLSFPNSSIIELVLYSGNTYTDEGLKPTNRKTFPFRRLEFNKQTALIDIGNNDFERSDEDFLTSIMMNINQLDNTVDSLKKELSTKRVEKVRNLLRNNYRKNKEINVKNDSVLKIETAGMVLNPDSLFFTLEPDERQRVAELAVQNAREVKANVEADYAFYKRQETQIRKNQLEWHKKFTFPFACIIFFFIGAPLGGIIRKGGLGAPIVISVFLFIIYYVVSMIGERSAKEGVMNVILGAWLSSIVFLPLGIMLTYKSVTDSEILNAESYMKFVNKFTHFFKKKRND